MADLERAEEFIKEVEKLVKKNYSHLEIAEDHLGGTSISTPSNSVKATVYIKPNKYNLHIEADEVRRKVEEIASIASGRNATSLTDMRQSRESSKKNLSKYPDNLQILQLGGTENRGYPIFEIDMRYLNRDV